MKEETRPNRVSCSGRGEGAKGGADHGTMMGARNPG
jgi:hypothetical protein